MRFAPAKLLLAVLLAMLSAQGARAGEIRRDLVAPSPILGHGIPYTIYLPDGYEVGATHYPVLFLLHGTGGGENDWPDGGGLVGTLERLTDDGTIPPMLVVSPGLGDSWYVDSPDPGGYGKVESAFLDDLVPYIDRTWRTEARRDARAVAGLSMGGWGAVRFAILRPDLFVAAGSLSGALITDDWAATPAWAEWFGHAFGTPFDFDRFHAASPFTLIPQLAAEDPRPLLFLTCGDHDSLDLKEGNLLFHLALEHAGIPSELRITDGAHSWDVWARELDPVLRFVAGAFQAAS